MYTVPELYNDPSVSFTEAYFFTIIGRMRIVVAKTASKLIQLRNNINVLEGTRFFTNHWRL